MDDLISRQAAIDAIDRLDIPEDMCVLEILSHIELEIGNLPSAQPDLDEWCTDCREYDSEKHCCPKFNRVIREALKEAKEERKTGHWIRHPEQKNIYGGKCIECAECGEKYMVQYIEDEKFCRNCGAKMEWVES